MRRLPLTASKSECVSWCRSLTPLTPRPQALLDELKARVVELKFEERSPLILNDPLLFRFLLAKKTVAKAEVALKNYIVRPYAKAQ